MRHRVHRMPPKPIHRPKNVVPQKQHNSVKPNINNRPTNNRPNKQIAPRTPQRTNTVRPNNARPPMRQNQGVQRTNRTNRTIR